MRDEFLADPDLRLVGYQVDFEALHLGLLLFNHEVTGCGTTLAIAAGEFADLYDGPLFTAALRGTGCCPRLCLRHHELEPCLNECECAFVRQILQVIRGWPKGVPAPVG